MPRARSIKPAFFKNEECGLLPPLTRLLFIGLWTLADRSGRLEWRPLKIKAEVFPYDSCQIEKMLFALADRGLILIYEADGAKYISIPTFEKHQTPHMREPASTIPAPVLHCASTVPAQCQHKSGPSDSYNLLPDSRLPAPPTPPPAAGGCGGVDVWPDDAPERIEAASATWPTTIGLQMGKRLMQDVVAQAADKRGTLATLERNIPAWATHYRSKPVDKRRRLDNLMRDGDWMHAPPSDDADDWAADLIRREAEGGR